MRVVVISNLYPPLGEGGYELQAAAATEHLRRSHEVLVLSARMPEVPQTPEPGVERILPWLAGRSANVRAPMEGVRAARLAQALVGRFRPDVVSIWNADHLPHALLLGLARAGVPLAFSVFDHWYGGFLTHDQFVRYLMDARRPVPRLWSVVPRAVARAAGIHLDVSSPIPAGVAWPSQALRSITPAPPLIEPVIDQVIMASSAHGDKLAQLPRRPAARPFIAMVGRVAPEKGPDIAIRALGILRRERGRNPRLVFAGPVERKMRNRLTVMAAEEGVGDLVEFRGAMAPEAVGEVLSAAHALVVPSVWEEPYGLVAVEGALARVPVVISESGGLPEILNPGRHALMTPRADVRATVEALETILDGGPEVSARVERAFERAQELSFERWAADTERFIADTAALAGSSARYSGRR